MRGRVDRAPPELVGRLARRGGPHEGRGAALVLHDAHHLPEPLGRHRGAARAARLGRARSRRREARRERVAVVSRRRRAKDMRLTGFGSTAILTQKEASPMFLCSCVEELNWIIVGVGEVPKSVCDTSRIRVRFPTSKAHTVSQGPGQGHRPEIGPESGHPSPRARK